MLSIAKVSSSDAAVSYYENDDYYASETSGDGQWYGAGAKALGLSGSVDRDDFKAILDGHLPDGTVLGTQREGKMVHTAGWDLTFSAPKSVSVAALVGGDERLISAHNEAVKEALDWVEKTQAEYRRRGILDTHELKSENLVIATFQHGTSRAKDPELHTHSVVANATQRQDGKWVSLNSIRLYDSKMAAGNIYRAALAEQARGLGYEVTRTHKDGRFELSAVPDEILKDFSKRREEIEAALKERGLEGAEASAQAALMTRGAKEKVSMEALVEDWKNQSRVQGYDPERTVKKAIESGPNIKEAPLTVEKAVRLASDRLAEREAVFRHHDLVRWALAAGMGHHRIDDVERAVSKAQKDQTLEKTLLGNQHAWTTPQAKFQERKVLESLHRGQRAVSPMLSRTQALDALDGSTLNESQRQAALMIATSPDRYNGVLGRPGVGKTFMLGQLKPALESAGYTLKGMAGNSEAARQIHKDSGIESGTIQSHLAKVQRDILELHKADTERAQEIRETYSKQLWVVDEASQVESGLARRLLFAADRLGARVTQIGDTSQLAAIGSGKPFDQMLRNGMRHTEMDQIRRQRDEEHVKAIREVIRGDIKAAMETLKGNTKEVEEKEKRLEAIVAAWRDSPNRNDTYILTARTADKTLLNDQIRSVLREEGKLPNERAQTQLFPVSSSRADLGYAEVYQPKDLVRFGRAVKSLNIESGEYLKVIEIDQERNTVYLQRLHGKTEPLEWNPAQVAGTAKRGVELYRPRATTVAEGEVLQWGRNDKHGTGLSNGQNITVVSYKDNILTVLDDTGKTREIDTSKPEGQHFQHAYATTIYKSQGATAQKVLVNAESGQKDLFSQKAFLVAISRQKEEITLFTDNREKFTKDVAKELGDKTSVQDGRAEELKKNLNSLLSRFTQNMEQDNQAEKEKASERYRGADLER